MSVSIDIYIYDKKELFEKLREWGADDDELTVNILESCGTFFENSYVLLNNECWDGYSPYYNVSTLLDSTFKKEDSFDIFLHSGTDGINSVDLYGIADKLGIEITDDDE